jgi:two-component system, NarL family, response regulator LiaR
MRTGDALGGRLAMTQEHKKIRVLIVDDHAMVREGLRAFLQFAPDIEIVAEAGTGVEAIDLCRSEHIDVVLMDVVMPGQCDGIAATKRIKAEHPDIQIIALTSFQDTERTLAVIEAGAISYLQKDVNPDDLLFAIRQAAAGRTVLDPSALSALLQSGVHETQQTPLSSRVNPANSSGHLGLVESLTVREEEVLEAMARGMSNKEIAAELGITEKTVKVHVSHILAKLGVFDRTQAVIAATKLGLIELK